MKPRLLCVMLTTLTMCITSQSSAAGYFNMPTNLRQCLGYGYGPGYHAPMLLGPMMKAGTEAQRLHRVPSAFSPPPRAWMNGPTSWNQGHAVPGPSNWDSYLATPHEPMPGTMGYPTPAPQLFAPGAAADGLNY